MQEQDKLSIQIAVNTEYRVLDLSYHLPFNIIFGLARRSHADFSTQPLLLETSGSTFDVPFALSKGWLKLLQGPDRHEVDLTSINVSPSTSRYVSLPPKREGLMLKNFETHICGIGVQNELSRILQPGIEYRIQIATEQLHVQWWAYGERSDLINTEEMPMAASESTTLVISKSSGNPSFKVVPSLPTPPQVEVHLQMEAAVQSSSTSTHTLVITIVNKSDRTVSIQSRGHQRYLFRRGAFDPYDSDYPPRITCTDDNVGKASLIITDNKTGEMVYRYKQPICTLQSSKADLRPRRDDFTTLAPSQPFSKRLDVSDLLVKLPNGEYSIELDPLGAWWSWGSIEEIFGEEDKIPKEAWGGKVPPVCLGTKDKVRVRKLDGVYSLVSPS